MVNLSNILENYYKMTIYFATISKNVVFYIPPRFMKSKITQKNYKYLMMVFQNVFKNRDSIINFLNTFQKPTESEISLKHKVNEMKQTVMDFRRKYVVATWRPEDSDRLHNEMTTDISELLKEHSQIGVLLKKIKELRK